MSSVIAAAVAGPLDVGSRVGIALPLAGTLTARAQRLDGRTVVLDVDQEVPEGSLEAGSIVDMVLGLSWGLYKWLCMVSGVPEDRTVELQLLDAPMFIQRRLDPRVGVGLAAQVRPVRSDSSGQPFEAIVADLSHGGLKLEGARPLRAGDVIEVSMELSATLVSFVGTITLRGRVVMAYPSNRSDDPAITDAHVCFLDGQQEVVEAVDRFVAQQLKCRWRP